MLQIKCYRIYIISLAPPSIVPASPQAQHSPGAQYIVCTAGSSQSLYHYPRAGQCAVAAERVHTLRHAGAATGT